MSLTLKCRGDGRKELYANIVMSGGNSMFPGIIGRLQKEMEALVPATKVASHPRGQIQRLGWWFDARFITHPETIVLDDERGL